jgi:hypothetical protein
VEGLDTALKELAEAKPYMLKKGEKAQPRIGPTHPGAGREGETVAQRRERLGI